MRIKITIERFKDSDTDLKYPAVVEIYTQQLELESDKDVQKLVKYINTDLTIKT